MSNGLTTVKLQASLNNSSDCLLSDYACDTKSFLNNSNLYLTDHDMYQYCSSGSNLLTEDICHNWFTHSMYEGGGTENCTSPNTTLYKCKREVLDTLLSNVCAKYPYHKKCACVTGINETPGEFSFDINPSETWPTHCLYPACSKADIDQRKQSSLGQPFLPKSVIDNTEVCPSTICTVNMKDAKINVNGGQIDISNYCSNFGEKEDDDEEEYLFMIGEFKVTALYLVIGIIIFLLIILFIIIIILSVNKGNKKTYLRKISRKNNS